MTPPVRRSMTPPATSNDPPPTTVTTASGDMVIPALACSAPPERVTVPAGEKLPANVADDAGKMNSPLVGLMKNCPPAPTLIDAPLNRFSVPLLLNRPPVMERTPLL